MHAAQLLLDLGADIHEKDNVNIICICIYIYIYYIQYMMPLM